MKIRVRTPNGTDTYDVEPGTAFGLFRFMLEEKSGIAAEEQKIMSGFPPKPIEANAEDTLEALGITAGEQLIVEKQSAGGVKQGHTMGKYVPPSADKGFFVRREMPSDNTCLFHTAAYVLEDRSRSAGPSLRRKIAEVVAAHPEKFDATYLGQPNIAYCSWIQVAAVTPPPPPGPLPRNGPPQHPASHAPAPGLHSNGFLAWVPPTPPSNTSRKGGWNVMSGGHTADEGLLSSACVRQQEPWHCTSTPPHPHAPAPALPREPDLPLHNRAMDVIVTQPPRSPPPLPGN